MHGHVGGWGNFANEHARAYEEEGGLGTSDLVDKFEKEATQLKMTLKN